MVRQPKAFRFQSEHTLGKLAKWLRILGFDTTFESGADRDEYQKTGRILLTRTESRHKTHPWESQIFITSDHPMEQLKQVVRTLEIERSDLRPFTRCVLCNASLEDIQKGAVIGKVPDYIWEIHDRFHVCPDCSKIYWPGSHTQRTLDRIKDLFI